ncbi:unnamed protein product [Sphenostylis stenocarpa]|uniref:Uncharacterized protein n=1 Tax=Sphenostylis stenocarpa TaxID=92480 RepID=A0AA86RV24_9FABA|nr:unnamed protein product [Sphenostylis stenocarpa]
MDVGDIRTLTRYKSGLNYAALSRRERNTRKNFSKRHDLRIIQGTKILYSYKSNSFGATMMEGQKKVDETEGKAKHMAKK